MTSYQTVTLTGTYQRPDGSPKFGTVDIIPSEDLIVDSEGNTILSGRVKIDLVERTWPKVDDQGNPVLDGQGEQVLERGASFSVVLPATDDPSINPTGFGYTVSAKLHEGKLPAVSFSLPAAVPVVDMADVTQVLPSSFTPQPNYSAYVVALETGFTGTQEEWLATLVGPQGEPGPEGPQGPAGSDGASTWDDVSGKPTTFKPDVADPDLKATIEAAIADAGGVGGGGVDRVVSATVSGGTYTADLAVGDVFDLTLTGNATLAVTGLEAGRSFVVIITQDATGGRVLTLPTATGTVSLDTTASTYQELVYYSLDGTSLRVRQPGAGGPPPEVPMWSPAAMADKIAWFNAASITDADATAVSSWGDSFAVAGAATQATSTAQPSIRTVNGVRVVRFDGGDRLTTATFTTKAQPITIAALVKFAATTAEGVVYGASTSEPAVYGSTNVIGSAGTSVNSGVPASTTAFQTIVFTASGASSKIRVDGTEVSGSTGSTGLSIINLGTNSTGGAGLNGDVAEAIVVGHAVTGAELTELEAYLNAKKADLAS